MKKFIVFNTSFFGDILLTSPLIQDLKNVYETCEIIMIVNKPFGEVAKYLVGVDKVIAYDKKGIHKGIAGFIKFYRENKNYLQNADASFVIYGNERNIILSKILKAKKIFADNSNFINFLTDNDKYIKYPNMTKVADKNLFLAHLYHQKIVRPLTMKYQPPIDAFIKTKNLLEESGVQNIDNAIVLCTTSKKIDKDMPLNNCLELILECNRQNREIILVGAGQIAKNYADNLHRHKEKFIDLVDKTSISELGALLKIVGKTISVDTGTMHLSLAVGAKTVCLFYIDDKNHIDSWAPSCDYKSAIITRDFSAKNILDNLDAIS